jgi:hypothetical protein
MAPGHFTMTAILVGTLGMSSLAATTTAARTAAEDITLTGCLVRGEGDGAGYLLSNPPGEPAWQRAEDKRIEPNSVGTSGGFESIFYWLDGDDELRKHVGHAVQITGELEGDLDDGQIEIDRKKDWTEMTVKAGGRTMKAQVPHASASTAPGRDGDDRMTVLVRRVDVERVEMLGATCARR